MSEDHRRKHSFEELGLGTGVDRIVKEDGTVVEKEYIRFNRNFSEKALRHLHGSRIKVFLLYAQTLGEGGMEELPLDFVAEKAGISERTAKRVIKGLKDDDWIVIKDE
jgi:hypothetical protein